MMEIEWGTVPTWFAFGAAMSAVIFTWRALVRERNRDAARELKERKAQADRFSVWIDKTEPIGHIEPVYFVQLRNASDLPVYNVSVRLMDMVNNAKIHEFVYGLVRPGEERYLLEQPNLQNQLKMVALQGHTKKLGAAYGTVVYFRDATGIWWRRDEVGHLDEED